MLKNFIGRMGFGIMKMAGTVPNMNHQSFEQGIISPIVSRSTSEWLKTFGKHALLYPPVNRIATDIAGNQWGLFKIDKDGKRIKVEDHPAIKIFEKPSASFLGWQFRYLLQAWLDLVGEAFLLISARDKQGQPEEFLPIPPHWLLRRPGGTYRKYQIQILQGIGGAGKLHEIPESEILRIFNPDPYTPFLGALGAAFSLDDEITGDTFASKWNNQFFRSSARPDMLVSLNGPSEEMVKSIDTQWNEKHQGFWNAHRVAFTNAEDMKVIELSKGQKETEFIKGKNQHRDRINQAYGIPPEVLGVVENSNRATAEAAMVVYQTSVLKPRLEALKAFYNVRLLPQFGGTEGMFYDFENPVQESKQFIKDQAESAFMRGAITRNEFRREIGMNPAEGEDGYMIPRNVEFVEVGQEPQAGKEIPKPTNGKSIIKKAEDLTNV